jgi:hypothetical protein
VLSFFRAPDAARRALPAPLLLGAALVGIQGLIGVVIGVAFMIGGVVGGPSDAMDAQMIGGLTLLMGAGLLLAARALLRRRRAARAPALSWQLIMLGVGFSEFGENQALSVPLIVVGAVTTVLIFHPATNEVLED